MGCGIFVCCETFAAEELIQPDCESPKHGSLRLREASVVSNHGRENLNQLDEVVEIVWLEQIGVLPVVRRLTDNVEAVSPTGLHATQLPDAGYQGTGSNQFDRSWVARPFMCANICRLHFDSMMLLSAKMKR